MRIHETTVSHPFRFARLAGVAFTLLSMLAAPLARGQSAQPYPNRPINVIVGYPAGGGLDSFCRTITTAVGQRMGQSFVVQNRPGAEGMVGLTSVARAAPDGYTLACVPHSMTQSPHMAPVQIDVLKDLTAVAHLVRWQFSIVVRADHPAMTLEDLIAQAKAKPGEVTVGLAGTSTRLTTALLEKGAGIKLLPVPYPGTAPVQQALLGGQVAVAVADTTFVGLMNAAAGARRVRALAVLADKRDPSMADVPAISEIVPGLNLAAWYGVVAPAGLPPDVLARLNAEFTAAANSPALKDQLAAKGWVPVTGTAQEFGQLIRSDYDRYGVVIRESGLGVK